VTSGFAIQRYNVGTNTWDRRSWINATAMNGVGKIGNRFYMTGGGRCCAPFSEPTFNTTLAYEPSTNRLFQKANLPRATTDGVTGVIGTKLYVLAGFCSGEPTDPGHCVVEGVVRQFYRYDPVTDTWINRRQPPHFHRRGAGAVIDGKFYVVGGVSSSSYTTDLDVYDPVTNSWTTRAPIPTAGSELSAAVIQNRMFVVSVTFNFTTGSQVVRAYSYDPATNIWKSRAAPPVFNQIARVQLNGQARLFLPGNRLSYLYAP
jgi:N-acetylneuraminic acid mutarotase